MFDTGEGFDWATAEALAFGTLLAEGHDIRLSGQDSGRGTFSQRHAVWVDQESGEKFIPLTHVDGGRFEVRDSPAVRIRRARLRIWLFARRSATLVLWEAQFGDFANGAQTIIDQFIAAGEAKWLRASGLVMLLPHGFEGQGPEHSSARLERYLAALRRGQSPGRQLHDAGELFPHPAAAAAPRLPQAADHDDAEVAAAAQARGFDDRGLHRRQPFPADRQRPSPAAGRRDEAAGAVHGQARLRADGGARRGRRSDDARSSGSSSSIRSRRSRWSSGCRPCRSSKRSSGRRKSRATTAPGSSSRA